ncbi:MAG: DUF2231 domain-containing protein [Propioniciclava sp.]
MEIDGLPLHPLVVHAAVVLVPATMVGAIITSMWSPARRRYGSLLLGVALVTLVSVVLAVVSGNDLLGRLAAAPPILTRHQQFGSTLVYPMVAVVLGIILQLWADRTRGLARPQGSEALGSEALGGGWMRPVGMGVSLVGAATGLVMVVLTGHSGATAVWG